MQLNIPFEHEVIKKLPVGLTNDNYLVLINNSQYIVRVPINDLNIFNRNNEKRVLAELKNSSYTIPVLYYADGIQISKYEPNLINYEHYNKLNKLDDVAYLMKSLHAEKTNITHTFNPIKQVQLYYKHANTKLKLEDYDWLFQQYANHTFTPVLCHNDWVDGNICFIDKQPYLIDFEYAALNDPLFDVMSFITENDLSNEHKKEFTHLMLGDNIDNKTLKILEMYRDLNNLIWYLWAVMMHDARQQPIYETIANSKLKELIEQSKKPLNFL